MTRRPELRPATADDIKAFAPVPWTCRAIVADLDGEVLGIGGIYYDGSNVVAFSKFDPRLAAWPFTMARAAKTIMNNIVGDRQCIAFADPNIEGSADLLKRLGFRHLDGSAFEWKSQ